MINFNGIFYFTMTSTRVSLSRAVVTMGGDSLRTTVKLNLGSDGRLHD